MMMAPVPIEERCLVMTTQGRALYALFWVREGEVGCWNGEKYKAQQNGWCCVPAKFGNNPPHLDQANAAVFTPNDLMRIDGYEKHPQCPGIDDALIAGRYRRFVK